MIKTVIFDLGGVIVPLDFPNLYKHISARCGIPAADIPARIGETGLVPLLETGQMSGEEFTDRIGAALGFSATTEEFQMLWNTLFHPHTLIPETLLEAVKQRHRLLLLSNTNALHFDMIRENYPLLAHFDHFVLSYEVGAMKPSARIYEEAISHARCLPEECFFTDDIPAYVEAARGAGIDAVQFQSYNQIHAELASRGVL